MDIAAFQQLVGRLTSGSSPAPIDAALESFLNAEYGPESPLYQSLFDACKAGLAEGWLCTPVAAWDRAW